jgi:hypothetical protein
MPTSKKSAKSAAATKPAPAVKTAAAAKAEATEPSLRSPRRGGFGRWLGVGAMLAGVVLVIVVIASGGENRANNATVADGIPTITIAPATPAAPSAPQATVTAPTVKAAPAAPAKAVRPAAVQPAARTVKCDPIVGSGGLNGGKTYAVTSSASSGRPTTCGEAHSVLLSALSGSATQLGDWNCTTDTSRDPIAVCHSSGRTIQASG